MKSALNETRRARPLLGTFVEITAQGIDEARLHQAIDEAFSAVGTVHRLMNFHDPASDVSRLNTWATRKPVRVHQWTRRVLLAARNFSRETFGAFDITVAPRVRRRLFPPEKDTSNFCGDWRDVIVVRGGRVQFRRPLLIDLGGIAKGFAVDRATEALIRAGVRAGIVNAGGDLRVFGSAPREVQIRHPLNPACPGQTISLRESSLATSVSNPGSADFANQGPLVDGRTQRTLRRNLSASVCAPECMTADALTKVVLTLRHEARQILRRHRACAFLLSGDHMMCGSLNEHETKRHQA